MIVVSILSTSFVIIISCILAYFTDFTNSGYKFVALFTSTIIIFIMTTMIGTGVSIMASDRKCQQYRFNDAIKKAVKSAGIISSIYLLVFVIYIYQIPYIKGIFLNSFTSIAGEPYQDSIMVKHIILCFWAIMVSWCSTADLYFNSQKDGCQLTNNALLKFQAQQKAKLKKKPKEKKPKMVSLD